MDDLTENIGRLGVFSNFIETTIEARAESEASAEDQRSGSETGGARSDRFTQTPGLVIKGKQGEVIVALNCVQVQLIINNETMQRLQDSSHDVEQLTDLIVSSLARLNWNAERILERAMTVFKLKVAQEMTPQLHQNVAEVLRNEQDTHRVQQLIQQLFEDYQIRLLGIDLESLVFILEHSSVDDAELTLGTSEDSMRRQRELQQVMLTFIPEVSELSTVTWSVGRYSLTEADRRLLGGLMDSSELSLTLTLPGKEAGSSASLQETGHFAGGTVLQTEIPSVAERIAGQMTHDVGERDLQVALAQVEEPSPSSTIMVRGCDLKYAELYRFYFENPKRGGGDIREFVVDEKQKAILITFDDPEVAQRLLRMQHTVGSTSLEVSIYTPPAEQGEEAELKTVVVDAGPQLLENEDLYYLYFESTRHGGGEVEAIDMDRERNLVYITFSQAAVAARVAARKHSIMGRPLEVTVYRPPKPEPTYPNKLLFKNVADSTTHETLCLYLERVTGMEPDHLLYGDDASTVLVTFDGEPDLNEIVQTCQKILLEGRALSVTKVPLSKCLLVENLNPGTTEDSIQIYFENRRRSGGDAVERVDLRPEEGRCFVHFEDPNVPDRILNKAHKLDGNTLVVKRYMECLGESGGSEDPPGFVIPKPVTMDTLNHYKLAYLCQSNTAQTDLLRQLSENHAKGTFRGDSLVLECTLTRAENQAQTLARTWAMDVRQTVENFVNGLDVLRRDVKQQLWEEAVKAVKDAGLSSLDRVMLLTVTEETSIVVVGEKNMAQKLFEKVTSIVQSVEEAAERWRQEVTETNSRLKEYQLRLLQAMGFQRKAEERHRGLKVEIQADKKCIVFSGRLQDVKETQVDMYEAIFTIQSEQLTSLSPRQKKLLGVSQTESHILQKFEKESIVAVWELDTETNVTVFAFTDKSLAGAIHVISTSVQEHTVQLTPKNLELLQDKTGMQFMQRLMTANPGVLWMGPDPTESKLYIVGIDSIMMETVKEIEAFLQEDTIYSQVVHFPPSRFLFIQQEWPQKLVSLQASLGAHKVKISMEQAGSEMKIKGTTQGLVELRKKLEELNAQIVCHEKTFTDATIIENLHPDQLEYCFDWLKRDHHCVLSLKPESADLKFEVMQTVHDTSDGTTKQRAKSISTVSHVPLPNGVTITAVHKDITQLSVDVIVRPTYKERALVEGLSQKIIEKGGLVKLEEGDVWVTKADKLPHKTVLHAVGPVYQGGHSGEGKRLHDIIMNCLAMAADEGHSSIAFPTFSSDSLGFPEEESTQIIAEAVKAYSESRKDLKVMSVYLSCPDDTVVQMFTNAIHKPIPLAFRAASVSKGSTSLSGAAWPRTRRSVEGQTTEDVTEKAASTKKWKDAEAKEATLYIYVDRQRDISEILIDLDAFFGEDSESSFLERFLKVTKQLERPQLTVPPLSMSESEAQCFYFKLTPEGEKRVEYSPKENQIIERALRSLEKKVEITDVDRNVHVIDFDSMMEYPRKDPAHTVRVLREVRQFKGKRAPFPAGIETPFPMVWESGHRADSSATSGRSSPSAGQHAPGGSAVCSSRESHICWPEWQESDDDHDEEDDDDEEVDATDRLIRFLYSSDDKDEHQASYMGGDEEGDSRGWFEKSEQALALGESVEEEEAVVLSDRQASDFERGGEGRAFYPDFTEDAEELLRRDAARYKRCQLKIEGAHKATAKVLDKGSDYSTIVIEGRSKAGRTYMDDEVVVEVLAEPAGRKCSEAEVSQDKLVYGKVVGLLKRVSFANVEHPVLFCTLDGIEGHLMRPLCKTVPKIHVMSDTVRSKYPMLVKNRIEIKTVSAGGHVHHKAFCDVKPEEREQYVFRVVLLGWRQRNIYPLGAVLDAHISGKDYSGGLQVLSMQQRVPKFYSRSAVEDIKKIVQDTRVSRAARVNLTDEWLFTIDPPGSKDLDDAISLRTEGAHQVIGVHIADVAAVVKKDSGADQEARRRAVTFYPLNRAPHCMLPEPLSHGKCSLLPGEERLALSVFFTFDHNAQQVAEPEIRRTVIKSRQQLTYEQAQKVIEGQVEVDVDPVIQEDIRQIHQITSKLRAARQREAMLFVPFEDPRLPELETINDCVAAHALIEELMILTNSHVAGYLIERPRYRDVLIVRCHKAPTFEELCQWQEKEGHVTNLVMQLQGKRITPGSQLCLNNSPRSDGYSPLSPVVVQRQVWQKLCGHLEDGEIAEARRLAFMDAVHPLQCLATNSWMDLMATAEYRCAHGLYGPDLRHFGLDLAVYTHFTSPIRRYADLHVQRLLHAALDGTPSACGPDDVTELCQHINGAMSRQKAFGQGCMALRVAEQLQHQPLVFRSFIDTVDDDQLTVFVPSLHKLQDRKLEVPFSVLGISSQPEVVTDTVLKTDSVTVRWNRRCYDERGTCPESLLPVWHHLERLQNRSPSSPVLMTISPDQLSVAVERGDWTKIVKSLASNHQQSWDTVPQTRSRNQLEVEYVSSERGKGTASPRPVQFCRTYSRGQIVQLQMSSEPHKGLLKPRTDIVHLARNACMCTLHVSEPVLTLTRHATRPTRDQQFTGFQEYMKSWMPLLEMEAATGAGKGESAVVIDNVHVTMQSQKSSDLPFRGSFRLKAAFCYTRCIEFGGKSAVSTIEDEGDNDTCFPLDYLCLRYRTECCSSTVSRVKASSVVKAVDTQYTWLAHASVVQVGHKGKKREDGGDLVVTFVLSSSSPPPPPPLLKEGARVTIELLPKADVDRRAQELLFRLQDSELKLARAIAFGSKFPQLDKDHQKLGMKDKNHEVIIPNSNKLPKNNNAQLQAIQKALTNSVAMIQAPPGSGKMSTGIKLVYLFCKINRQLRAEGKGRKTVLYCGPSNESVDLVTRELKSKLGPDYCPKIVRVYGSAIEAKDYPVPRGDIKPTQGLRDLCCDPDLQDVALHHLIRQDGKPYAAHIAEFEKFFDKCREEPSKYSMTVKQGKQYSKLLYQASVEELWHYDVVLATCAVGGSSKVVKGIQDTVFQLIIDECAMSPEPQSMIPIVATGPKQVVLIGDHKQLRPIIQCQAAADLGLDQSLFERLFQRFPHNTTCLDTQYRMHPAICAFPSKEFYDGRLKTGYSLLWGGDLLPVWPGYRLSPDKQLPHLLVDVRGQEEMLTVSTEQGNARSTSNSLEADKVIEIVTFLKREFNVDLLKIKLLTQYNAQRHLLEVKLKKAIEEKRDVFEHYDKFKVKVSTVVSSQGGEWDYVILSTVRSLPSYKIEPNPTHDWCRQNLGFIADRNQVNVALTRARRGLFIVGNVELLRCDDVWRHLVERYQRLGCYVGDPSTFPLPPAPRRPRHHARHVQHRATDDWQQV